MNDPRPLDYETFVKWFPEFKTLDSGPVGFTLDWANDLLPAAVWKSAWPRVAALYTAHLLYLRFGATDEAAAEAGVRPATAMLGAGSSLSVSTTSMSESKTATALMNSPSPTEADLGRTEYGLQLLALIEAVIPVSKVVFSPDASGDGRRMWR